MIVNLDVCGWLPSLQAISSDMAATSESSVGRAARGKNAIAPNAVFCWRQQWAGWFGRKRVVVCLVGMRDGRVDRLRRADDDSGVRHTGQWPRRRRKAGT
ncbi:hypothetical protein [Burkholderia vietnamiensis]|uniref:hypothetical protein n=1 Tax=Burkholderia vietnamiensis TaxID=60552 RepID=UPI0012D89851|nr:hypothetical protein [Burkholderia vietnamiensis]